MRLRESTRNASVQALAVVSEGSILPKFIPDKTAAGFLAGH